MKKLTLDNLDDLAVGSAILGSGGGGDPSYFHAMSKYEMTKKGFVSLIGINELKPDDFIIPIGHMGAPLASIEKLPNGHEFPRLFKVIEQYTGKKITVIMPFEIGGHNSFAPLMAAAHTGLPVLDADTMGRAFPETQMSSCNLQGVSCSPGFISDCLGNTTVITALNSQTLEKIGRQIIVAMGSTGAFAFFPLRGDQVEKCTMHRSLSKAIAIGKVHREAREGGKDPLEAVLSLCKGVLVGSGKIVDIDCAISKGFLNGTVKIQGGHESMELCFQNEYLIAKKNNQIVATTPDILVLLEQNTGAPVTSECLQYGIHVNLIALPAPPLWTTPEGLALVGPRHFGYEIDFHPCFKTKNKKQVL